jgi:hypothetical protein
MTRKQIIEIQKEIGVDADGFWGEKSTAACKKFLHQLMNDSPGFPHVPAQDQKSLTAAYGAAGEESQLVNLDVSGLGVKYDGATVKTVRVNKACAESLKSIIKELATFPEGQAALAEYAGVFNNRPMRGGSLPSLHARGAAIDLMPATNRNKQHWPSSGNMPFSVMKTFARHGWLAAGAFWSRDAMHFQRTR